MKKLLITLLLFCSPVWCITALGEPSQSKDSTTEKTEEAAVDSSESQRQEEQTGNGQNDTGEEQEEKDQTVTVAQSSNNSSILNWVAILLSLVSCGIATLSILKVKQSEAKISRSKKYSDSILISKIEFLTTHQENLEKEVETLKESLSECRKETLNLRTVLTTTTVKSQPSQSSNPQANNKPKPSPSQAPSQAHNQQQNNQQISYASGLHVDDSGELTIPGWAMNSNDTTALFRVKYDPSTGSGTYELNPQATNVVANLDNLNRFAIGVTPSKTAGYITVTPGKIKREGQVFKVISKLHIG